MSLSDSDYDQDKQTTSTLLGKFISFCATSCKKPT